MKENRVSLLSLFLILMLISSCETARQESAKDDGIFPPSMVQFEPIENNPVFEGTGTDTWDKQIRERGYILYEDDLFKMWYTGYDGSNSPRYLGYATSQDGIEWSRYSDEPIFHEKWTEDMQVVKHDGVYYMVAEGPGDVAHLLTSENGITWVEEGDLSISKEDGQPISEGPYGTPTLFIDGDKKYLFYERDDEGIWLATSMDFINWTNVKDEPVIAKGPHNYDIGAVAANQIVKYQNRYYMYYHASSNSNWADPNVIALWSSNVAMSDNLVDWVKYPHNPIVDGDHSSPIVVPFGEGFRLYTMHDQVWLYNAK